MQLFSDIKSSSAPIVSNASASLWNIGEGAACLEFHSKMNSLDTDSLAMMSQAVDICSNSNFALIIYNEAKNFSVGANLVAILKMAEASDLASIKALLQLGQKAMGALKFAPVPVVAAPAGLALGGGCEVLLHCDAIIAADDSVLGLVETSVGLVPSWGGCKELLLRQINARQNSEVAAQQVFSHIFSARTFKASEAVQHNILQNSDEVSSSRANLFQRAKARALSLAAQGYAPPKPATIPAIEIDLSLVTSEQATNNSEALTLHDAEIAKNLASVLSAGPCSEAEMCEAEVESFMRLVRTPETLARIRHMLATGQALRN